MLKTTLKLLKITFIFFMLTASASVIAEELKLSPGDAYKKTRFPALSHPAGWVLDPLPAEWKIQSLDGNWKFKKISNVTPFSNPMNDMGMKKGFYKRDFNDSAWGKMTVPGSWYRGDNSVAKLGWYRHRFNLAKKKSGIRYVLDFSRVANQVDLWVNGRKVQKRKEGRFNTIRFDITSCVHAGENLLAVRVYDCIGNTGYRMRQFGGIYGPVRLLTINSPIYVNHMMITTDTAAKTLSLRAFIVNKSQKEREINLTAEIAPWKKKGKAVKQKLTGIKLAPGVNDLDLGKIKVPSARLWSPDKPNLYTLTLKNDKGVAVGLKRFGFRDFKAEGEWLLLNGKKFKPRMFTFDRIHRNDNSKMEKMIRLLKSLNVNMIRPHSGAAGTLPETFLNLCDEIGMLVYVDWSGLVYIKDFGKRKDPNQAVKEAWPALKNFIIDSYSHPSFCMLSFQNEMYETPTTAYGPQLDALYGLIKKIDLQNRPIISSSGRLTAGGMLGGVLKERTDVLDDHQYRGATSGSWQDNIKHLIDYAAIAEKYYKGKKPKIDAEYGVPGDSVRYRRCLFNQVLPALKLDPSSLEFKRKYIGFLKSEQAEIGGYIRGKMNFISPREYMDEKVIRKRSATCWFKRPVEIYRRAETKCLGGHTNAQIYDVARIGKSGNTSTFFGHPGPIPQEKSYYNMPLKSELKRIYNPTLVSAGVFNEHPLPGSKQRLKIYVTNDLNTSGSFKVIVQLRIGRRKALKLGELDFGKLKGMEQKSEDLNYTVPLVKGRQRGQIEFFLFKNGKRVGDNVYPITIVDNSGKVKISKKIALYDAAATMFRGLDGASTAEPLKKMGLKPDSISDFKKLDNYKYLIIGSDSFDKNLIDASEKIYKWVKKGGKLLCMEQSFCGKIPFFPNYSITAGSPSTFVSMAIPTHPAFKNLKQEDFDSWAGFNGLLYDYAISPLDEGFVAVDLTGSPNDTGNVKSILCDIKLGNGEILFSQFKAVKRAETDSVALGYLRNLLNYFLQDGVSHYAVELPEKDFSKILYVNDKDAYPIDLRKFVNRGFLDAKGGDRKGGWADFGAGFQEIPTGLTRLQGGVPFKIIDPTENDGKSCIVLRSKKRPYFPAKVTGIPVNAKLNSIFFLQTSMYGKTGPVVKYVFHYANGATKEFTATAEKDIPDWWKPKDKFNALVVFRKNKKGLYLSEFVNPLPKVEIKSMDIISSEGDAVPIIIAITGRKRFTSVISGVGEK